LWYIFFRKVLKRTDFSPALEVCFKRSVNDRKGKSNLFSSSESHPSLSLTLYPPIHQFFTLALLQCSQFIWNSLRDDGINEYLIIQSSSPILKLVFLHWSVPQKNYFKLFFVMWNASKVPTNTGYASNPDD